MKKKILFVAMSDSIHTARWIDQIIDQKDWKIYLFPSFEGMDLHQKLNNVTIINSFFFNSFYFQKLFIFTFFHKLVLKIYNKFFPGYYERRLLKFINYLQNCGLLAKSTEEIDYEEVIFDFLNYEYEHSGTVIMITKK